MESSTTGALPIRRVAERRMAVLVTALGLFALVFVLRQTSSDANHAIELLYVVPISLVALELGLLAGVASAALALGLVGLWALAKDSDLSAVDVAARAVTFVSVAAVTGHFSDRMRRAQRRQQRLLESGLALSKLTADEQLPAILARGARELVDAHGARVEMLGRAPASSGDVSQPRERIPIEARGVRYGTVAVDAARSLDPEDRATLAILAVQGAVAAENQRLLEDERERAAIRVELDDARRHLVERGRQLRELMVRQEAERRHVAHELHDEAAQMLAAVLLGMSALERELDSELAAPRLGALRSDVDTTLRSLRALAMSLRPPVLDLGLQAALATLAGDARDRGLGEMTIALEDVGELDGEVETMVYRVVEEALASVDGAQSVLVRTGPERRELEIVMSTARRVVDHDRLALLSARLELVGGTLSVAGTELRIATPLAPRA